MIMTGERKHCTSRKNKQTVCKRTQKQYAKSYKEAVQRSDEQAQGHLENIQCTYHNKRTQYKQQQFCSTNHLSTFVGIIRTAISNQVGNQSIIIKTQRIVVQSRK